MWTTVAVLAAGVAVGRGPEVAPLPRVAPPVLDPKAGRGGGDTLRRLVDRLADSGQPTERQVDALFLASLGRSATRGEQERARKTYGETLTAGQLRELLAEVAAAPGFRAHAESLQDRLRSSRPAPDPTADWWRPTYPPGLLPLVPWVPPGVPTEPYLMQKFKPAGAPGFRDPPKP
ncbi:MAG: hypothetical protein C0501_21700 [Isosphaera sp.]|nr:hypothetical protein [Isosphaera sp.]